jgi:hypothetical protein
MDLSHSLNQMNCLSNWRGKVTRKWHKVKKNWLGKEEDTEIEYEISLEKNQTSEIEDDIRLRS